MKKIFKKIHQIKIIRKPANGNIVIEFLKVLRYKNKSYSIIIIRTLFTTDQSEFSIWIIAFVTQRLPECQGGQHELNTYVPQYTTMTSNIQVVSTHASFETPAHPMRQRFVVRRSWCFNGSKPLDIGSLLWSASNELKGSLLEYKSSLFCIVSYHRVAFIAIL